MIRVRQISGSSKKDERKVCWCLDESFPSGRMGLYCRERRPSAEGARLSAEPSEIAKRRHRIIMWYQEHGQKVRLTARHFGFSPFD